MTSDLSVSASRTSSTSNESRPPLPPTASAASRSKPPAKTESRSNTSRSTGDRSWYDHSTVDRRVRCRASELSRLRRKSNRSASRAASSAGVMARTRGRRERDGQRDPVHGRADRPYVVSIVVAQSKLGSDVSGPIDEQLHRGCIVGVGRQRTEGHDLLAGDGQRLPAGCHDAQLRAAGERRLNEARGGDEHVFAVVEHHQSGPAREPRHDRFHHRPSRLLGGADGARHGARHGIRRPDRGQITEPDAT